MLVGCNLIYVTLRGGFWLSPVKSEGLSFAYNVSVIRIGMAHPGSPVPAFLTACHQLSPSRAGQDGISSRHLQSAVSVL